MGLANTTTSFNHEHTLWQTVLDKHHKYDKKQALFNYKEASKDVNIKLYLNTLATVSKNEYDMFSEDQKLAFLINAYNAFTVKLIIQNYPVKSIKKIGSFFKSAWKQQFITILGKKVHLDYIEHTLIRKKFNEPRIHFAVVCASISCPNLQEKVYTSKNLSKLLDKSTKEFLTDKNKNMFIEKTKSMYLSKIFKWYGEDFNVKYGSIQSFVSSYVTKKISQQKIIASGDIKTKFLSYDWGLNEWK